MRFHEETPDLLSGWELPRSCARSPATLCNVDPITGTIVAGLLKGGGTLARGLGPTVGAIIGEKLDPTSKAYLANLQQDTRKMAQGRLGWTGAQTAQAVGAARRDIDASTRGMETELRREAAASGGFGRSGAQQSVQEGIAAQKADAVAQARTGAEALSQQQAIQAAAAIRLAAQRRAEIMAARGAEAGKVLGQVAGEGLEAGGTAVGVATGATPPPSLDPRAGLLAGPRG